MTDKNIALQKKLCPNTDDNQFNDKQKQILYYTEQCFACQNTYGKGKKYLEVTMRMMAEDLKEFDIDVIKDSFQRWRRENRIIPTPSDMIDLCRHIKFSKINNDPNFISLAEYKDRHGGSFPEYKRYMIEKGFWYDEPLN